MTFYYVILEKRSYTREDSHTLISYVLLINDIGCCTNNYVMRVSSSGFVKVQEWLGVHVYGEALYSYTV